MGYKPHIISRGYGGSTTIDEVIKVKPHMDFNFVGDEALMMSNYFTTWVSKNKFHAMLSAKEDGANILVLDDALQSYNVYKNISIYVYVYTWVFVVQCWPMLIIFCQKIVPRAWEGFERLSYAITFGLTK